MSQLIEPTTIERALPDLDQRFSGELLRPGDQHYAAARALWNGAIDRRPALIARPHSDSDVAMAVVHARDVGLEIAVRGGGHSLPGHSMAEGGLTIDLSALNGVRVDPATGIARVGGGALLNDVAEAGAPHALSLPFGHVSHTGVGGFTLGGGLGWLMRRFGLAIDRLRSARMVTAAGEVVTADAEQHPELFWALRGGGGNFGIVTEFEFELCAHEPEFLAGMVLHPLEHAAEALRFSRDFMDQAPDELTLWETLMTVPPEAPFPPELHGRQALALAINYAGPVAAGERVLRPLREFGSPALDMLGPMPAPAVGTMLDPTAPHGMQNYSKSHWLAELPDGAIERMVELHADVPSPMSIIVNGRMGGAVERVGAHETAFAHRDAHRLLWVISSWWEGEREEQTAWCRGVFEAMAPYSSGGVYVNALDADEPERVRASYDPVVWDRLVDAKRRWDPDNVFCLNQNIAAS